VKGNRDQFREDMRSKGVICNVYYPLPLHLQPIYRSDYHEGQFPHSEQAANEVLSLPMFPELTPEQQKEVAIAVKSCLEMRK
jgi:dTDP-4-amino-4,6-dideoxygalactose transaminase